MHLARHTSAIAAYGRPLIDSHEENGPRSVTFEWQKMFWIFEKDGVHVSVVINDDASDIRTLSRKHFEAFLTDHTCTPSDLPAIGNRSESWTNRLREWVMEQGYTVVTERGLLPMDGAPVLDK